MTRSSDRPKSGLVVELGETPELLLGMGVPLTSIPGNTFTGRAEAPVTIEELYDGHHRRVHALALRMTGDPSTADQLTHEILVRAWRSLGSFRGECAVETWLHRIAIRSVIDHRRATGAWQQQFAELDDDATSIDARAREVRSDDRMDLERAIARLPVGARAVLVMHDIEGFKYEEIASALAVSVGTVKSQLHRARRLLIEWLEK